MLTHANKHARSAARAQKAGRRGRLARGARFALIAAAPVIGAGALASPALANSQGGGASTYQFKTLDNPADLTFNQLLGINQAGEIAGYFGSGAKRHPNKGYLLLARHGQQNYLNENWPQSTQTQVTGLNDRGVTVGFWSTMNTASQMNDNRAFVSYHGYFIDGDFPTDNAATPPVDQLLGVNDNNLAVGFYNDGAGDTHAYTFNILRNQYSEVTPTGITNPTAAAINNRGEIAGFGTDATGDASNGQVVGYLLRHNGNVAVLSVPGSSMTQALGIDDRHEVVGVYTVGTGDNAMTHGFTWTPAGGFQTQVDDPHGMGATTINGINDQGQLVGFFTDANGNTDGFLATPN
jgi:probable HAF family extracellular repeat protein